MGGITQANISAIVWEVCKTRPLTGFCSAAFLWFHLSPPLQLFFLGHAGGASDSLYALQPSPESSFLTSGGGGAVSERLSPEGLDLWCLSLNLPVPLLGAPSIWAEPTPASSYTAVPRCAGARTSCPHTVRNGGEEWRPGNFIPRAFGGAHKGLEG